MGEESEKPNKIGVVATMAKKPRHRKKLLYQALKKQMEFYFSDVNISKDRFMNDLLQKSPYVDLSVFLSFNKIKSMTTKEKVLANALQTSDLLKVTEDGTKVFRTSPPQQKENSDECTIYVEQLPLDADHTWLMDVFQPYGDIDYVSIPKFKHSRKNKGFAFVEFKDPQSAKNALAAFTEIGCCLPNQMDPGNLCSIRTFEENENEIININKNEKFHKIKEEKDLPSCDDRNSYNCDDGEEESNLHLVSDKKIKDENNFKKRKHISKSSNSDENEILSKIKSEIPDDENEISPKAKSETSVSVSDDNTTSKNSTKHVKEEFNHRKRRHSSEQNDEYGKKRVVKVREESKEIESLGKINVKNRKRKMSESNQLSDSDNEGKEKETEEGGEIKNQDLSQSVEVVDKNKAGTSSACEDDAVELSGPNNQKYEENIDEVIEDDNEESRKRNRRKRKKHRKSKAADNSYGLQILSKMEWKSLRNKYLNEQRRKMKELKSYVRNRKFDTNRNVFHKNNSLGQESNITNSGNGSNGCLKTDTVGGSNGDVKVQISNRLTLTPGLIVKVTLTEPVLSKISFKNEAKIFPEIKYIDVREGSNMVYLRFSSAEAAENCVKSNHWANAVVIKDDEEKGYWDKIAHERETKLTKGRSVKRGRDKLLKKAEEMHVKHIWFD